MKKVRLLIATVVALFAYNNVSADTIALKEWSFALEQEEHAMPAIDSKAWQQVTIPHDWAIGGPFDRNNDLQVVAVEQNGEKTATEKTGRSGGLPWMGAAWYRCEVESEELRVEGEKSVVLYFDGAMSRAEVYVNGKNVGFWPYGYNAFYVDITDAITTGKAQTIAVRLENKPESSRWYPGAGLYRHVNLIVQHKTHIPVWGVNITTPYVEKDKASVMIDIAVENKNRDIEVETDLMYDGQVVGHIQGQQGIAVIEQPQLWSPETPYLYTAVTIVSQDGKIIDTHNTRFGIRKIQYAPGIGFMLNNEVRKFRGVCLHHDLGPLGTAVSRDAIRHQLTMLQEMGCDAIRTTHNMPSSDMVELCEEMGFMLIVEPFDVWRYAKCRNDYSTYFDAWSEKDMTNMLLHFRTSPAVVMWSIGNEIGDQRTADGITTAKRLQDLCHRIDPTRPVTCGMDQVGDIIYNGFGNAIEIPGLNYRTGRYEEAHRAMPLKQILGSETASTVSSRGVYKIPAEIKPDALYKDNQSSGYDLEYCSWSGLPDQDFALQDDYDWTIGQFVWTGFDYLGEPSPYDTDAWPSHSSYFGIIDLASLPKDRYWFYRSQWRKDSPTLHVLPHWNWEGHEGEEIPVYVYTSYPEAELFVNGVSQGRLRFATAEEAARIAKGEMIEGVSEMPKVGDFQLASWGTSPRPELTTRYRLMWQHVPYQKGEIRVIAYDTNGQKAAEQVIYTAGKPHHIEAHIANEGEATEEGLHYVTIRIVDKDGNLCPNATNQVSLNVDGCQWVAGGNGDATCLIPFQSQTQQAFSGQLTAIVKGNGTLTCKSKGLKENTIEIR